MNDSQRIVQKLWSYCNVLRDDGLSYLEYIEQLTFLLFLKMADERGQLRQEEQPIPEGYRWSDLADPLMAGEKLEAPYRAAVVVPDNVLFFDRKPAGEKAWTKTLWVYDVRTNKHFTLEQNPLTRKDLDEFVAGYRPGNRHDREPTWSEENPDGRWRAYEYDELIQRDKVSLDLFWLRDKSLEDSANLPDPHVLAADIADDLRAALEQIEDVLGDLQQRVEDPETDSDTDSRE